MFDSNTFIDTISETIIDFLSDDSISDKDKNLLLSRLLTIVRNTFL